MPRLCPSIIIISNNTINCPFISCFVYCSQAGSACRQLQYLQLLGHKSIGVYSPAQEDHHSHHLLWSSWSSTAEIDCQDTRNVNGTDSNSAAAAAAQMLSKCLPNLLHWATKRKRHIHHWLLCKGAGRH